MAELNNKTKFIFGWLKLSYAIFAISLIWLSVYAGFSTFHLFVFLFITIVITNIPKYILSPLNILFAYYGLWFVISPALASGYTSELLNTEAYKISIALVYTNFCVCLYGIKSGILLAKSTRSNTTFKIDNQVNIYRLIISLFVFSTLMVLMIVNVSGGVSVWIDNPGDAFLKRYGSGVYVILSHFSSIILASLVGFYTYKYRRFSVLLMFILWLALTSPVHGSKFQISLLLILCFSPWLRKSSTVSFKGFLLISSFVAIFILGMYFRGADISNSDRLMSLFNYFSTLHNLAISVADFDPGSKITFWLPFNKFMTPFGLDNGINYYDMNHYLTDIYYPDAWKIRATEQWPVETDLYLNFYFFAGLPIVFIYMMSIGYFYKKSLITSSFGLLIVSLLLTIFMISHLRGSLYNHTDFYMVPYLFFVFACFRRYKI